MQGGSSKGLKIFIIIALVLIVAFGATRLYPLVRERFFDNGKTSPVTDDPLGGDGYEDLYKKFLDSLKAGENIVAIGGATDAEVGKAVIKVYDTPEIFWVDNKYQVVTVGGYTAVSFTNIYSDIETKKELIEKAADEILSGLPDGDDFEKVLYIHDALCDHITYDDGESPDSYNIYGAFVRKKCKCEGYAKAFAYLLDKIGIRNTIFSGDANNGVKTESHAWNGVVMDGELYYFDPTWDDNDDYGTGYNYFAVTSSEMQKKHFFDENHPAVKTEARKDNYFIRKGYLMDSYSEDSLAEMISDQGSVISIKCSSIIAYEDLVLAVKSPMKLSAALTKSGAAKIDEEGYGYILNEDLMTVTIYLKNR